MEEQVARILLVDDRMLTRSGLRSILQESSQITVVGEAVEGAQALDLIAELHPDVVILDSLASRIDTAELARDIMDRFGETAPGVVLLANAPETHLVETFKVGVRALLLKHLGSEELISAVSMVKAGYTLVAPRQTFPASAERKTKHESDGLTERRLDDLTRREFDVFELVARGLSNSEISENLSVSESTVKSHVRSVLNKLKLQNRVQVVIFAYKIGLARASTRSVTDHSPP